MAGADLLMDPSVRLAEEARLGLSLTTTKDAKCERVNGVSSIVPVVSAWQPFPAQTEDVAQTTVLSVLRADEDL